MRRSIAAVFASMLLLLTTPALAAPTCLDKRGDTVRCDRAGAMPVGWTPSPQQQVQWQMARPPGPGTNEIFEIFGVIALFLALIALMPDFDGSRAADWDRQEGDE